MAGSGQDSASSPQEQQLSFESVLLAASSDGASDLEAYRNLLQSNLPRLSDVTPGSLEISNAADRYMLAHKLAGEKLPFFSPYDVRELNHFSILTGVNFVVYRNVTPLGKRLLAVASTKLFAGRPLGQCRKVLLRDDGSSLVLEDVQCMTALPMLNHKHVPQLITYKSPKDLLGCFGLPSDGWDGVSFIELRNRSKLLNEFSAALDRPVVLMAVNRSTRFGKTRRNKPFTYPKPRYEVVEQRATASSDTGDTLTLFLDSDEEGFFACTGLPNVLIAKDRAKSTKPDFAKAPKRKREDPSVPSEGSDGQAPTKKSREDDEHTVWLSHVSRVDDCCSLDLRLKECDACLQMTEEFKALRMPPIESRGWLHNPSKNCSSVLAEARAIGLCSIFPDLEDALRKADLLSCMALDIETLNVPVGEGSTAGSTSMPFGRDDIRGGTSQVTKHVVFVIGCSSFKIGAVLRFTRKGILWRICQESGVYREFRVPTVEGVPDQPDVKKCVSSWLNYALMRRRLVRRYKRRLLAGPLKMLASIRRKGLSHTEKDKKGKKPNFDYTIFGRFEKMLLKLCDSLNVITYNGNKFDILHLLPWLLMEAEERKLRKVINRKGTEVRFLSINKVSEKNLHSELVFIKSTFSDLVLRPIQAYHAGKSSQTGKDARHREEDEGGSQEGTNRAILVVCLDGETI